MTSLCLQNTRTKYGNIAVSYHWKVTYVKRSIAMIHKLYTRCPVNLYDNQKRHANSNQFSYSIHLWKHCQPWKLSSLCVKE